MDRSGSHQSTKAMIKRCSAIPAAMPITNCIFLIPLPFPPPSWYYPTRKELIS